MRERARAFAATVYSVYLFEIDFATAKFSFCGALFKCILAWEQDLSKRQFLK